MDLQTEQIIIGIVVGAVGGSLAGLTVWIVDYLHKKVLYWVHCNRAHKWLSLNTKPNHEDDYRSTRTIASYNNLTEDRVRFICSEDSRIVLSTGETEDLWGIKERVRPE